MKHTEIINRFLFPPRKNAAEAIHPTVCSLHHPATRLETGSPLECLRFIAARFDVSRVAECIDQVPHRIIIVSFVHAHALRFLSRGLWPFDGDAFQCGFHHFGIMPIGSVDGQSNRNAFPLRQQTSLNAVFGSIRRVGTDFFPRPAVPWSSRRRWTAMSNRYLSSHHTPGVRRPKTSEKRPPLPILEIGHAPYYSDKFQWHSRHSTGNLFATRRKWRSGTHGHRLVVAHLRNDACSCASATMVESCSTTHLTHNTDSFARSSPIPPWFIPIEVSAKKGYSDRF